MPRQTFFSCLLVTILITSATAFALSPSKNENPLPIPTSITTVNRDSGYRLGDRLQSNASKIAPTGATDFKEISWEMLLPKNWDPMKDLKNLNLETLQDGDPRAMEALQKMRAAWDNAPVEPTMNGAKVRIPGFIVPLDTRNGILAEFLLVPYFGSCIHTPPPPSNQVIHVMPIKPVKMQMMEAVWISGVLETTSADTVMGRASYQMKAMKVTPYIPPKNKP
jgi:hypothetical protein